MAYSRHLRILAVHNYYYSRNPSGENLVFDAECDLLRRNGHQVDIHIRRSDEIRAQGAWGAVKGAMATPWNPFEASALRKAVDQLRPDVVHVHNTFPLVSPAIFHSVGRRASKVLTLHNYRLFCPAAIPMRAGRVCTECLDRKAVWPSLVHGCYRGSRLATAPVAAGVALHRWLGTWNEQVDAFIVLSEFQKEQMARAGFPVHKMHVKPNFFPGTPTVVPWDQRNLCVVFVGRLSEEKGVRTLIHAWRSWGTGAPELRIIGDGPLGELLRHEARDLPVTFLGQVAPEQAQAGIARARLLVLPSQCFEGFPMVVREAFAFGTPVAVSDLGPLPSIVTHGENGVLFRPADAESLFRAVQEAWKDDARLALLGKGARMQFEEKYTEEANYAALMNIYEAAIRQSGRR